MEGTPSRYPSFAWSSQVVDCASYRPSLVTSGTSAVHQRQYSVPVSHLPVTCLIRHLCTAC
ncbi:hypothetical protein PAXRUDRAFT_823156 [Paxillus rubicundulus Ve08.2h10]|uniref:Uncharacterized protein n=1 Tax=Paxillus rubicundulus Ve08.2h10 TaxID=930991 RepID=A0A0D0E432_9AGAM|nr:hypothetical protein PAXRUDRAFT_823156 [Paxillus rubicundulus Ve08.2h10]